MLPARQSEHPVKQSTQKSPAFCLMPLSLVERKTKGSPGMHPAFPGSELLLVGRHHLNLQVIFEVLKEIVLLKQAGPADLTALAQKVITDVHSPSELILHIARELCWVLWSASGPVTHIRCIVMEASAIDVWASSRLLILMMSTNPVQHLIYVHLHVTTCGGNLGTFCWCI